MKNLSRKLATILSLVLVLLTLLTSCGGQKQQPIESKDETSSKNSDGDSKDSSQIKIQDDLYMSINEEWLKNSVIPDDQPTDNPMLSLDKEVTNTLMSDFQKMIKEDKDIEGSLGEFLKLYEMYLDYDKREELGTTPLKPFIEKLENISNFEEFNDALYDLLLSGYSLPFSISVGPDIFNTEINTLNASSPMLFLGAKEYYTEDMYAQISPIYSSMAEQILVLAGKTVEEAKSITEQAMAFDMILSEHALSMEEQSSYATLYSEVTFDEFASYSKNIDFNKLIQQAIGTTPEKIIVSNKAHFEALDEIVTQDNFENMKNWMIYNIINAYTSDLSDEIDIASYQYSMALMGVSEVTDKEERAYNSARVLFSTIVGKYYGETYFGDNAKEEVTEITKDIISVYREKLENNDWLSESTKEKAIQKLDAIQICMAYPDDSGIDPIYNDISIDTEKTLIENLDAITRQSYEYNFSKYGKPHDKNIWTTTGDTVNAFYNPINNSISFTAAIMQEPFYSENATISEKYGSFGSVVGHEISHAFDPNGSLFDEKGNLNNWWTEEDYAKFEERAQLVYNQFDGVEYAGGQVNAALTNSENIADNSGIKASFDAANKIDGFSVEEFFKSWAKVWRTNSTPEYEAQLLVLDNHSPSPLRVNIPVSNFEEFYEIFEVTENDGMFRPIEERIFVW